MDSNNLSRRDFGCAVAGIAAAGMIRDDLAADESDRELLKFGLIADAQYCDAEPAGSRYYRQSREKLAKCVSRLNEHQLEFTIHLGDFIDRDFRSFGELLPVFERLESTGHQLLGNHDFSVDEDRLDDVPRVLGMPSRYYAFARRGCRFVVLDGNDLSLIAYPDGSDRHQHSMQVYSALKRRGARNAQTYNGGLSDNQLEWLRGELNRADAAGERVIVFCHFPIYPPNAHNLWNDAELVDTLGGHQCVVAYFNGHNHAGNYGQKDGVHYVTVPGMVETRDTNAFAVVHVHPDHLEIVGHGRVPDRSLKFR